MASQKAKVVALASLGVVLLGVGAFQLTQGSPEKKAKPNSARLAAKAGDQPGEDEQVWQDLVAITPHAPRDPFQPGQLAPLDPANATGTKPAVATNPPATRPIRVIQQRPSRPIPPLEIGGTLPGLHENGAKATAVPDAQVRRPDEFGYAVSGVIIGSRPMAVLQDESGVQRLVKLGASVDGESQVIGIERGKVTVRHRGKVLVLRVGGNSSAK
jgi:hypothetical protein